MMCKKNDIIKVHPWEELIELSINNGVDKDGDLLFAGVYFIEEMKKTCGRYGKIKLVENYNNISLYIIDFIIPLKTTCYFTEEMFQLQENRLIIPTNTFNEGLL